jgi:hypothetical protein
MRVGDERRLRIATAARSGYEAGACGVFRGRHFRRLAMIAIVASLATGCSYQYVDDRGNRHVIGLVHMVTPEPGPYTSDVVAQQVTTIGAAILYVPETTGVSIGYTRNFVLRVGDNTAGEIAFDVENPSNFTYKDYNSIMGEYF